MRIAVASETTGPAAEISIQGARALNYLLFDESGNEQEILANPYVDIEKGAGPEVAHLLANIGVTAVIAGRFGPKFKSTLIEKNIECIETNGPVMQVVKEYLNNK
jgi:predicted Fe-Mo cluster-binding NifX family protein